MPIPVSTVLPIREYLLTGLVAAVITFLLTGPVRVLAVRLGAVAWPRGRDVHSTPTPRWGGLAMLGGVLGGVLLAYQLPALRLAFGYSDEVVGGLVAVVVLGLVGVLDDRFELDALTKLAGQTTAAGLLVLAGVQWFAFWIPWGGDGPGVSGSFLILGREQGVLLTVVVTVALVNSMNFVDGLDGLAAGVGLIAATATALFAIGLVRANGNDPGAYSPALLAVVLSLCSEADAFVVASLTAMPLVPKLVFLVVGPAIDLKLAAMQAGMFGRAFMIRFASVTFVVATLVATVVGMVLL